MVNKYEKKNKNILSRLSVWHIYKGTQPTSLFQSYQRQNYLKENLLTNQS